MMLKKIQDGKIKLALIGLGYVGLLQQEVIQQAETLLVVEIPQVGILQQAETQQMVEIQHNRSLKENYIL